MIIRTKYVLIINQNDALTRLLQGEIKKDDYIDFNNLLIINYLLHGQINHNTYKLTVIYECYIVNSCNPIILSI